MARPHKTRTLTLVHFRERIEPTYPIASLTSGRIQATNDQQVSRSDIFTRRPMTTDFDRINQRLSAYGQEHLLRWWDELSNEAQQSLSQQISSIDFDTIQAIWQQHQNANSVANSNDAVDRVAVAESPQSVVRQPASNEDHAEWNRYREIGEDLLSTGKIGVITVAGGQGTRLGFDQPKGMFPIGPVSQRTLFQVFAEQIQARRNRHSAAIPWLIMTSAATHDSTIEFFQKNKYFGLGEGTVSFFQQGNMPAVDATSGKVLMADKSSICLSPDGHGGLVTALDSSGLLKELNVAGVEHLFYHQVDNPTVIICDPALLGVHHDRASDITTNVVRKRSPTERMGVLVDVNNCVEIIEYSELNEEQASRKDTNGDFVFWAGNTAIHVFSREFLSTLASGDGGLELHIAHKAVPHIDKNATCVQPSEPNANKFERFIFDALPLSDSALIVEGDRNREFNPVKNADGDDSPATSKAAISRIGREWLALANCHVDDAKSVEISPLVALDAEELSEKLRTGDVSAEDLID